MELTRKESDGFGSIEVPLESLWGPQTQRSLIHFNISTEKMPDEFNLALTLVKKACILANSDLNLIAPKKVQPLLLAIEEILSGLHKKEFPLSIWQTGSATQTNMNINEVLANRAMQLMGGHSWHRQVHSS